MGRKIYSIIGCLHWDAPPIEGKIPFFWEEKISNNILIYTKNWIAGNFSSKFWKRKFLKNKISIQDNSKIGKQKDDQVIYISIRKEHDCKDYDPCECKNVDYKEFSKNHDMKKYSKTLFLCDGKNEFYLAKNMKKNDAILLRKNYDLYKKLYNDVYKNEICGELFDWASGNDIIDYLRNII